VCDEAVTVEPQTIHSAASQSWNILETLCEAASARRRKIEKSALVSTEPGGRRQKYHLFAAPLHTANYLLPHVMLQSDSQVYVSTFAAKHTAPGLVLCHTLTVLAHHAWQGVSARP
jgi:hypothetical protein